MVARLAEFLSYKTITVDEPPGSATAGPQPATPAGVQWHWSARSAAASAALPEAIATSAPAPQPPDVPSMPVPRVLHIDSDDDAAQVLATLLLPEARVTHAPTLEQASHLLACEHFTLVILDPDLRDGDGTILLDALKSCHVATPVLLYSRRDLDWPGHAQAALRKPWTSPRELWRTVAQLLGIPASPDLLPDA